MDTDRGFILSLPFLGTDWNIVGAGQHRTLGEDKNKVAVLAGMEKKNRAPCFSARDSTVLLVQITGSETK